MKHYCEESKAKSFEVEVWFCGDLDLWYIAIDKDYNHNFPIDFCPFCGQELEVS